MSPEVSAVPRIGNPRGNPKSPQKRYEKPVLKKKFQKRFWEPHGESQGAPGSPNEAKMEANRFPKEIQKRRFFRFGWENDKCHENILFTILELHRPPSNMVIFRYFVGPKMTSKPKGNQMDQQWCQNDPHGPLERVQSRR